MASPKQKFDAAIKVIHSLPKEGPFQPSHEMMLTFYGFFKQATEGPCKMPKPNFWEVVKKAKWEAWHKLGDMEEEAAMLNYVEELKKTLKVCSAKWNEMAQKDDPRIVEAMPQTQVVGDFVDTLGTFYEMVDEEMPHELALQRQKNKAQNNNTERDLLEVEAAVMNMSSQVESALKTFSHFEDEENKLESVNGEADHPLTNGDQEPEFDIREKRSDSQKSLGVQSSDSEEEFCDTSDNPVQEIETVLKPKKQGLQMSTPLKGAQKSNHVHFADSAKGSGDNGRISPISQDEIVQRYVKLSRGFPHISSHVNGQISDSMLVNAPEGSDGTTSSLSDISTQNDFSGVDYSMNNSNVPFPVGVTNDGGEENEPPGGSGGSDKGKGGDKKGGESSRSTRSSGATGRGISGSYSARSALLSGSGAGGEDNPPQGSHSVPQDAMNEQITLILIRLQQDMNSVLDRLNRLETRVTDSQRQTETRRISDSMLSWWPFNNRTGRTAFFILVWPSWWPFNNRTGRTAFFILVWPVISWWPFNNRTGRTAFFILVWPVIVHLLLTYFFRRRRRQT